ncbi:thioredoxin family protein [Nitratifractor sp.]
MRRLLFVLLLFAAALWGKSPVKFSETIPYSGKPLMLLFDSQTCPYCEKMKKELESDPVLHAEAQKFDIYRIPRDDHRRYTILGNPTTTQNLQMLYKVKVTPYVVLLSSKGEKIWQLPGYVKPEVLARIMAFVEGVDKGTYKKEEWRAYLKKHGII